MTDGVQQQRWSSDGEAVLGARVSALEVREEGYRAEQATISLAVKALQEQIGRVEAQLSANCYETKAADDVQDEGGEGHRRIGSSPRVSVIFEEEEEEDARGPTEVSHCACIPTTEGLEGFRKGRDRGVWAPEFERLFSKVDDLEGIMQITGDVLARAPTHGSHEALQKRLGEIEERLERQVGELSSRLGEALVVGGDKAVASAVRSAGSTVMPSPAGTTQIPSPVTTSSTAMPTTETTVMGLDLCHRPGQCMEENGGARAFDMLSDSQETVAPQHLEASLEAASPLSVMPPIEGICTHPVMACSVQNRQQRVVESYSTPSATAYVSCSTNDSHSPCSTPLMMHRTFPSPVNVRRSVYPSLLAGGATAGGSATLTPSSTAASPRLSPRSSLHVGVGSVVLAPGGATSTRGSTGLQTPKVEFRPTAYVAAAASPLRRPRYLV